MRRKSKNGGKLQQEPVSAYLLVLGAEQAIDEGVGQVKLARGARGAVADQLGARRGGRRKVGGREGTTARQRSIHFSSTAGRALTSWAPPPSAALLPRTIKCSGSKVALSLMPMSWRWCVRRYCAVRGGKVRRVSEARRGPEAASSKDAACPSYVGDVEVPLAALDAVEEVGIGLVHRLGHGPASPEK